MPLCSSVLSELVAPCWLQRRDFLWLALCIPEVLGPSGLPHQSPALGGQAFLVPFLGSPPNSAPEACGLQGLLHVGSSPGLLS